MRLTIIIMLFVALGFSIYPALPEDKTLSPEAQKIIDDFDALINDAKKQPKEEALKCKDTRWKQCEQDI